MELRVVLPHPGSPETHGTACIGARPDTSQVQSRLENPIWLDKSITVFSLTVVTSELKSNAS